MNTLFEEFIGRAIRRAQAMAGKRVTLQGPRRFALRDEFGAPRFATKPDIIVHGSGGSDWIIDTKWKMLNPRSEDAKHGISQADVYQMIAYAQVYRCTNLMLLYPHHPGLGQKAGRITEFEVAGSEGTKLVIATVDVTRLESIAQQLATLFPTNVTDADSSAA
jgi:5-methylcytosine-specific restriction enzyme subunit McrC